MTVSFLQPSRCILLIGDDALYVYDVTQRAARFVEAISWQSADFDEIVIDLIKKDCGGKPLLILNDMTDQHFKGGQRLPNVGVMDRANVLARRLEVAFPSYSIRGALQSGKADAKEGGMSGASYLFAAVPDSEPVARTIAVALKSQTPIIGFYLLPVEATTMVDALAAKLGGKVGGGSLAGGNARKPKKEASHWVLFIGQHHSGALRQVITRNGQLAMTRMTPLVSTPGDAEEWAFAVSQELKATISYLSRFGYNQADKTDLILISQADAGLALEKHIDIPCQYTNFTAPEAARELGINIGIQDSPDMADPLHAAWIGRKTRFLLPMKVDSLAKVIQTRKIATAAMLLLLAGTAYFGWQAMQQSGELGEINDNLAQNRRLMAQADSDYQVEVDKIAALGLDVQLFKGTIDAFKAIDDENLRPLEFTSGVHRALEPDMNLNGFSMNYVEKPPVINTGGDYYGTDAPVQARGIESFLRMTFPITIDPIEGARRVEDFARRLRQELPEYTVVIEKNVAGQDYSDGFSGAAGRSAQEIAADDKAEHAVEISLRRDALPRQSQPAADAENGVVGDDTNAANGGGG